MIFGVFAVSLVWIQFQLVNIQEVEQRNRQPVRRRLQSAIVVLGCEWLPARTYKV